MGFDGFEIVRFSRQELDEMLRQSVCRVFYQWAVMDTQRLSDYWFIVVQGTSPGLPLYETKSLYFLDQVAVEYSRFPTEVESVLRQLVLYDWPNPFRTANEDEKDVDKIKKGEEFLRFGIPFVIAISHSLVDTPRPAPNTRLLATQPVMDPQTGEELGEEPIPGFDLSLLSHINDPIFEQYPASFFMKHQRAQSNPSHPTRFLPSTARIEYP
jgi:hypothetical protein